MEREKKGKEDTGIREEKGGEIKVLENEEEKNVDREVTRRKEDMKKRMEERGKRKKRNI